jgi:hypothetical protein
LEWKPNHIWAYDFTHFTRARRVLTVADLADDGFVEDADRFRCFFGNVTAWSAG